MINFPRVALFADTFYETNGAANVIRRLENFAREKELPFLCVRAGSETDFIRKGNLNILELKRSRLSFPIDGKLKYDPRLWRYRKLVKEKLDEFQPDVIHVTGLNDVSQLGFYFAHYEDISAIASWHTNAHEYTACRLLRALSWLPQNTQKIIGKKVESFVMRGLMKLLYLAQIQLAPNQELVDEIQKMTRRPSFLMSRGVDTKFLNPNKRKRKDSTLVLGYVGRLRPEKNVRFFAEIEQALQNAGVENYKFVLVGEGGEDEWLKKNLQNAELTGVLHGEELARAYADMDLLVFPSQTDAFGNVVLEAMASGVPAVVMPQGGPKFLIEDGEDGFIASDETDFLETIIRLAKQPQRLAEMRNNARIAACERSWERVFEDVYDKYHLSTLVSKQIRV
ncbi:MAG TPA: glycosyltransferase [Pyrinomonadaceae bacterium]|nr:glycosyltransferase [Pyrinomonadaceae bacterium]